MIDRSEWRTAHGLTISAIANRGRFRISIGYERHIATMTASIDLHGSILPVPNPSQSHDPGLRPQAPGAVASTNRLWSLPISRKRLLVARAPLRRRLSKRPS